MWNSLLARSKARCGHPKQLAFVGSRARKEGVRMIDCDCECARGKIGERIVCQGQRSRPSLDGEKTSGQSGRGFVRETAEWRSITFASRNQRFSCRLFFCAASHRSLPPSPDIKRCVFGPISISIKSPNLIPSLLEFSKNLPNI